MIRFNLGSFLYWITGPFKDRYPFRTRTSFILTYYIWCFICFALYGRNPIWIVPLGGFFYMGSAGLAFLCVGGVLDLLLFSVQVGCQI